MPKRTYHLEELSPDARRRALADHVAYLQPYFRELLTAHFEAELCRAGEPQGTLIFEPDLESLRKDGVRVEGAEVSPEGLRRLKSAGIAEMEIQLSEERLIESIEAEGREVPPGWVGGRAHTVAVIAVPGV